MGTLNACPTSGWPQAVQAFAFCLFVAAQPPLYTLLSLSSHHESRLPKPIPEIQIPRLFWRQDTVTWSRLCQSDSLM